MANNIKVDEGADKDVRTTEIAGEHLQHFIAHEVDGSATAIAAKLGSLTETAPAIDTASSGLNGRLQRIAQRITSLIALVPASLGQKAKSASLAVTLASDEDLLANLGGLTETAPATDTASSGLNGRLQRIAQRVTSLIALLPSSLGVKASSGSLSTVVANDDAMIGAVTETAPATDTASSGLNGRLQRIAQRITSLIALVPTSLGTKTAANSLAVAVASDDITRPRFFAVVGTTLTRPANQTAYLANESISNNGTAGSVTAMPATLSDVNDDPITIERIRVHTTDTGLAASKTIRIWVYESDPTASSGVVGGDNAAYSNKKAGLIGTLSGTFKAGNSDGGVACCVPDDGTRIITKPGSGAKTVWWQAQTLDAFTPSANSTTLIPTFEGFQGRA